MIDGTVFRLVRVSDIIAVITQGEAENEDD